MKGTTISILVAAFGLARVTASEIESDISLKLSISGTVYVQGEESEVGDIHTAKIDKIRVNTKDLLVLLSNAVHQVFPRGSYIEMSSDGVMTVKFKGVALADVTQHFSIAFDDRFEMLYKGKSNDQTFQESSTSMVPILVRVGDDDDDDDDDDGIGDDNDVAEVDLYLSGIVIETYKASAARDSQQRVSSIGSATLSGGGKVDGWPALFKGALSGKGSGVVAVDDSP